MKVAPKILLLCVPFILLAMLTLIVTLGNFSALFVALFSNMREYCSRHNSAESLLIANFLIMPVYLVKLSLWLFIRNRMKNRKWYFQLKSTAKIGLSFNHFMIMSVVAYPISFVVCVVLPCLSIKY